MKFVSIYADDEGGFVHGGVVEADVDGRIATLKVGEHEWEYYFSNGLYVSETNDAILVPIPVEV